MSSILSHPSAKLLCVLNTAASLCITRCMLRRISAVRRLPLALRSLSRRAMALSPALAGSGLCGALGLAISPAGAAIDTISGRNVLSGGPSAAAMPSSSNTEHRALASSHSRSSAAWQLRTAANKTELSFIPDNCFTPQQPRSEPSAQLTDSVSTGPSKHHNIQQTVSSQPVSTMHTGTSCFTSSKETRHDVIWVVTLLCHNFTIVVCGDATHVVVHCGDHRDGLLQAQITHKDLGFVCWGLKGVSIERYATIGLLCGSSNQLCGSAHHAQQSGSMQSKAAGCETKQ